MFKKSLVAVAILYSGAFAVEDMSQADINKSQLIAASMKKGLGGLLKQKLEKDGPVAAFSFCSEKAITSTKKIAEDNNATIKRVSVKLRNNMANKPDALDAQALSAYEKFKNESDAPKYLVLRDAKSGVVRFYEPMYVVGMCLGCHGDYSKIQDGIKSQITQKYPSDKAVDYKVGDFRGLIAVELKK